LGAFSLFYLIPVLLPLLLPQLRTKDQVLKQTNPPAMERVYTARQMDVVERTKMIDNWNTNKEGIAPLPLAIGDSFTKAYQLPQKSIFWSKGIKANKDQSQEGGGYIYLELLLLDNIGFDLSKNPYALNESIRLLIRLFVPFLLLIFGSIVFKGNQEQLITPFYTKMRLPVNESGKEADAAMIANALQHFEQTKSALVFPNSSWEFYKWNRQDTVGFLLAWGMVILVLLLLYFAVNLGS